MEKKSLSDKSIHRRGVAMLLAVLILASILSIGVGISTILNLQLKTTGQAGNSVVAFYAAESGTERGLYAYYKEGKTDFSYSGYLDLNKNGREDAGDPSFTGRVRPGESCLAVSYCITSVGQYRKTTRSIETDY